MYFLFLVSAFCGVQDFSDITELTRILKPFLARNNSIKSVEYELYKLFNNSKITISLPTDKDNYLEIQFNDIKNNLLPECLGRLINIKTLILMNNGLNALPEFFEKFTALCQLDLSSNDFNKLPEVLFSLENLINLYLSRNKFESIGDNIERLKQLQILIFSNNNIIYVSNNLKKLKNLKILNLSNNVNIIRTYENDIGIKKDVQFLKKMPESVKSLYIDNIRLRFITCDLKLFPNLLILCVKNNFIKNLFCYCGKCISTDTNNPFCIYFLKNLKELKLTKNKIGSYFFIANNMLSALEKLDLNFCNITEFEVEGYNIMNSSNGKYIKKYKNNYIKNESNPSNNASNKNNSESSIIYSLQHLSITIKNSYVVPNLLIFHNLRYLKITNKERNNLRMNPDISKSLFYDLSKMEFLKHLKLFGFNFETIPETIFNLKILESLSLNSCKLKVIPDELEGLLNLYKIDLSYNNITNINPKIFEFKTPIKIILTKNSFSYLPSIINNKNSSFKLKIEDLQIGFFKKDDNNLGIMDISYKKVHQIYVQNFLNIPSMTIEDIYEKAHKEEYGWELNKMLKIKPKEVEESQDDYNIIINYWDILENYITDKDIKYKFFNYLQLLYEIKKRRKEETFGFIKAIKRSIKNYVEAIFKILTNLIYVGNTENIEKIIRTIEPGLSICVIDQVHHFSYAYHLLLIDENESTNIESFIYNKIALLKYHALREILTNNNEEQNINKFLNWQNALSETLGLPFIPQKYGINTSNSFLKCKEYIIYQFFKLMTVDNVIKDLYGYINKNPENAIIAYRYISNRQRHNINLKEYVTYKKSMGITEKGMYFILEEMNLIKKVENKRTNENI